MDVQPKEEIVEEPAADEDDVEGHSVLSSIAVSGALRAPAPRDDKARNKADENLPPLTKPFPSMREDRRK
jgi:hypothetical protein